jgi:hypothetical protein
MFRSYLGWCAWQTGLQRHGAERRVSDLVTLGGFDCHMSLKTVSVLVARPGFVRFDDDEVLGSMLSLTLGSSRLCS